MPPGARRSPERPASHGVAAIASVAQSSPTVASELEELCHDALEAMRAQLEHGTVEDRIAVFKALAPMIRDLNSTTEDAGPDPASEARDMLLGHWRGIA